MKKKSAQLFDGGDEDVDSDNVQLTVNRDFANRMQVSHFLQLLAQARTNRVLRRIVKQERTARPRCLRH